MEPLEFLRPYVEGFNFSFEEFKRFYDLAYDDQDSLDSKVEFSMHLPNPKLRFEFFKIYDPKRIIAIFDARGYDTRALKNIIEYAKEFTPEFVLGFDNDRQKFYMLRLPDNKVFLSNQDEIIDKVHKMSNVKQEYKLPSSMDAYLLCIDFNKDKPINVKTYARIKPVDFRIAEDYMGALHMKSRYLDAIKEIPQEMMKDMTLSIKNSNNHVPGLSIVFELEESAHGNIDRLIAERFPQNEFKRKISTLKTPVYYNHFGTTFTGNQSNERICIYFSPKIEGT
jgi:hypothetical protein